MMGHKIRIHGEIRIIIPKLSLLPLLIRSTVHMLIVRQDLYEDCIISDLTITVFDLISAHFPISAQYDNVLGIGL